MVCGEKNNAICNKYEYVVGICNNMLSSTVRGKSFYFYFELEFFRWATSTFFFNLLFPHIPVIWFLELSIIILDIFIYFFGIDTQFC